MKSHVEDIRNGGVHIHDIYLKFACMEVVNKGLQHLRTTLPSSCKQTPWFLPWNGGS